MDFKSLQPGQSVYIIYKNDKPRLVVAEVVNPQYKEAKAQKQDIAELRDQMGQMMQMVADMQASLKSAKK